ncbi:MAG: hypothetical protein EB117_14555 [Betaproteobacteria bacterium]|nr:hypothetical protein [Betaproteobacteria bacterium]
MEHSIEAQSYDRIALSEHDGGLWMTIWKVGGFLFVQSCSKINQLSERSFPRRDKRLQPAQQNLSIAGSYVTERL